MSESAERAVAREGQQTYLTHARWKLWFNRRGKVLGIAIVHPASDQALRLEPNDGLAETDRIVLCEYFRDTLNKAEGRIAVAPSTDS